MLHSVRGGADKRSGWRLLLPTWLLLMTLAWSYFSITQKMDVQSVLLRQIAAGQSRAAAASGGMARDVRTAAAHEQPQPQQAAAPKPVKPIPPMDERGQIPALLQADGLATGAELGVLVGDYASHILANWPGCTKYYLVDLWGPQENYKDSANADQAGHDQRFNETKTKLAQWKDKTEYLRMFTTEAAKHVPDGSLDFVYVDARHDYCGVTEDLVAWWPKLRSGGVFAGHDFLYANDTILPPQDWSVCNDGSVQPGAVRGAVEEFAEAHALLVTHTKEVWPSWMARVP